MRTVAKHSYIKGRQGKAKAIAHTRYIEFRRGKDREEDGGRPRQFFNAARDKITGEEVREQIAESQSRGVVVHKMILSPGVDSVDMQDYTRSLMEELGRSKGLELEWHAVIHENTDHDHAHVVIMGQDRNGRNVHLSAKNDYTLLRDIGDRYIERYHEYDRYLDKEIPNLLKRGHVHDRGDKTFELLQQDLKSVKSIEQIDLERKLEALSDRAEKEAEAAKTFDREKAIAELPEDEKLRSGGQTFSKYSSLSDLKDLEERLKGGQASRISKEEYQDLKSWISTKERKGDDYYEKSGENERLQRQFDEDLKRTLRGEGGLERKMSFRQYLVESRGRLLESHERYEIATNRQRLTNQLKDLEAEGKLTPEIQKGIEEQLDWLKQLEAEESPKKAKKEEKSEGEKVAATDKSKLDEKDEKDYNEKDDPKTNVDSRVAEKPRDNEKPEGPKDNKLSEPDRKAVEDDARKEPATKDDSVDRDADTRNDRDREDQERADREDAERRERDQERIDQEKRQEEDRDRDDRDRREQDQKDRDEQDRLDQADRQDQEDRQREAELREEQRKAQERAREESERMLRIQLELDKLRQQQLEQGRSSEKGGTSQLQKKIDQYDREINEAAKNQERADVPILDRADGAIDLDKDIEQNWGLEDKLGSDRDFQELENEIDNLDKEVEIGEFDRSDANKPDAQGNIDNLLFGNQSELLIDEHEKLPEERQIENWEKDAFNPELIMAQQDRDSQTIEKGGEAHTAEELSRQQTEQALQQQIQQHVQVHIQKEFFEPSRSEDKEEKTHDPGPEHSR